MQARSLASRVGYRKALYPTPTHSITSRIYKASFSMAPPTHSESSKPPAKQPPTPRLSASLVVVNPRNQILLVQRNAQTTFGGFHVFPGGNYDQKQDDRIQMTAIRETFEESGLLLAHRQSSSEPPPANYDFEQARGDIHSHKLLFKDFVNQQKYVVDTRSLLPFTQWITPPNAPRRFHTHFFLVFLEETTPTGFTSGVRKNFIPTPDGGQEVVSAKFMGIDQALRDFQERKLAFMPPQYYILHTLSSILQGNANTEAQRKQVELLAKGAFGSMMMRPLPLQEKDELGREILTYEGDESRGGRPGRLHRASFRVNKGKTVTTEVVLHRNFDIFTEIDWTTPSAKL